jgi:hypothetical protein
MIVEIGKGVQQGWLCPFIRSGVAVPRELELGTSMQICADPLSIEPGALPERIPCREFVVAAALFEPIGQMVANLPAATADQDALALGRRRSS